MRPSVPQVWAGERFYEHGVARPVESSVEALQRVEAECGWSDAPALLADLLRDRDTEAGISSTQPAQTG